MYGSARDIKHNLFLFFIDGLVFMPAMTLISITSVIPYFLEKLGATTFQIALAASLALACNFIGQPYFGHVASHSKTMHKTFGKILFLQRSIFLVFVLCIPFLAGIGRGFIWIFLFFWGLFNFFTGSYSVFFTPLVLKLLPPDKRGTVRGIGDALGSILGLGMAALLPVMLTRISFPWNYTLIFSLGLVFLFMNAMVFPFMRQSGDVTANEPMGILQYLKEMPSSIRRNASFRAMILTCMFLVISNSLLSFYTLYAIRVFSVTETNLATLAGLAVIANFAGYIGFGIVVDRKGPMTTLITSAFFVILAGATALVFHSLFFLFAAWVFANLGNTGYQVTASLLLDDVSPHEKLPLYVGVLNTISMAMSTLVLLLLAPLLESLGFMVLFAVVLTCGTASLFVNLFVLQKKLRDRSLAC